MKKIVVVLLVVLCTVKGFAQTGDIKLAILPFTGAEGTDGDAIARFFSYDQTLINKFPNPIVRTQSNMAALDAEQKFQASGYTDSDTIAEIGKRLNAQYVISGHFRALENTKLVITTIIDVQSMKQLAGDYRDFRNIEDVEDLIPDIVKNLLVGLGKDIAGLPTLAIAPFTTASETKSIDERQTEALAQILAIEIGKTGKYAVLPRTAAAQSALNEQGFQWTTGKTTDVGRAETGKGFNADYVLSGIVSSLGTANLFEVSILDMTDFVQKVGSFRYYNKLDDGKTMMKDLAQVLVGQKSAYIFYQEDAKTLGLAEQDLRKQEEAMRKWEAEQERIRIAEERKAARQRWWKEHHTSLSPWSMYGGYTFVPDYPGGFRLGFGGLYGTFSFSAAGKEETAKDEKGNVKYDDDGKEKKSFRSDNTIMTLGYAFNIIDNYLIIPLGAGLRTAGPDLPAAPVIEAGYEIDLGMARYKATGTFAFSLYGTYRLVDFTEHSFSIGVGFAFRDL